jgi:Skp family chaperone for outer membrane proteins
MKNASKNRIIVIFFGISLSLCAAQTIKVEGETKSASVEKGLKSDTDFMKSPDALRNFIREEIQKSIAFINPFEILEKSTEYRDGLKRIEKELDSRKAQLKSLEETAIKKKTELETMGNALSETARERKREELVNLEAQYRIKVQGAQEYAQGAEEKLRMNILKKIQDEAEALAREENRIMVLAGGIIFGAKPIDLTQKVLTRLNKKYEAEKEKQKKDEGSKPKANED